MFAFAISEFKYVIFCWFIDLTSPLFTLHFVRSTCTLSTRDSSFALFSRCNNYYYYYLRLLCLYFGFELVFVFAFFPSFDSFWRNERRRQRRARTSNCFRFMWKPLDQSCLLFFFFFYFHVFFSSRPSLTIYLFAFFFIRCPLFARRFR